ncbi:MAG: DUF202 domain-containing protein [Rubrivivax sp.]
MTLQQGRMRDPGLQPERTAQAWIRTDLALLCNALLLMRAGLQAFDHLALLASGILCVGCAALAWAHAEHHRLSSGSKPALPVTEIRFVSLLTVLASAGAVSAILRSA